MIPSDKKHKMEAAAYLRSTQYYVTTAAGKYSVFLLSNSVACKTISHIASCTFTVGGK